MTRQACIYLCMYACMYACGRVHVQLTDNGDLLSHGLLVPQHIDVRHDLLVLCSIYLQLTRENACTQSHNSSFENHESMYVHVCIQTLLDILSACARPRPCAHHTLPLYASFKPGESPQVIMSAVAPFYILCIIFLLLPMINLLIYVKRCRCGVREALQASI